MNGKNDDTINPEVVTGTTVTKVNNKSIDVDTPSGAAWVRKYLHPPCATPDAYAGYPDSNNSPSTDAEYKGLVDISTAISNPGPPVSTSFCNKVLLLHTSSAIAPVIAFKQITDGTIVQLPTDVVLNRNINVQDMVAQNSSGRVTYKSTTSWLNATGFNNQGNVTSGLFRPNIVLFRAGDLIPYFDRVTDLAKRYSLYAQLYNFYNRDKQFLPVLTKKSKQMESEGYELLESDNVDVTQTYKNRISVAATYLKSTSAIDNFVQILQVGQLPFDPSQILMMSPNAVADKATVGSFVVQRFDQPSIMYKDFAANGMAPPGGVSTLVGMPCYYLQLTAPTGGQIVPITVAAQPGNATGILADLPWFDFMWGWTLYEGLSVQSEGATISPPYISVKTITGFEFQPLPDSMLSPFIRNCAVYDMSALRLATTTNHAIADSLPSAANFWGSIGKMLLTAAPSIIDTVSGLFGSKRSKEQKDTTDDTVKQLIAQINSMSSQLNKQRAPKPMREIPSIQSRNVPLDEYISANKPMKRKLKRKPKQARASQLPGTSTARRDAFMRS